MVGFDIKGLEVCSKEVLLRLGRDCDVLVWLFYIRTMVRLAFMGTARNPIRLGSDIPSCDPTLMNCAGCGW